MSDPNKIIAVYHGANVTEAHLVKNLLLEEGIDARVADEADIFGGLGIDTPDVLVHKRDQARAEALIAEYEERAIERVENPQADDDSEDDESAGDEDAPA